MPPPTEPADRIDPARRRLLLGGAGLAGAALAGCGGFSGTAHGEGYPFALGVASGEPDANGFVIWTRVDADPLHGTPAPSPIEVEWLVADDERLRHVVRGGRMRTQPESAHTLHVEVEGLAPDRWYWYAFRALGAQSPVGRARTLAPQGTPIARARLAVASCQNYENGHYAAYRQIVADAPDLVLHLGDYIYEFSLGAEALRAHVGGACWSLDDYRRRHAQYRLDPALQAAHAACPWFMTWDDHDVDNDYAGWVAQDDTPAAAFRARRAAAYQAYYEHLPLRPRARPRDGEARLHTRADLGDLARLHLLDLRQYRDDQACPRPGRGGGQVLTDRECPARHAPERQMLGAAQERWLQRSLRRNGARWNVLAQPLLMARLDQRPGRARGWWSDGWDGYPAQRERLLETLAGQDVGDTVVLGGDIHSFWANELRRDFDDPRSRVVASEFVGSSISSRGVPQELFERMLPDNPHVKFFDARWRGYLRCDLTLGLWRTDLMAVEDVADPRSAVRRLAAFAVEPGRPGPQAA